MVNNTRLVCRKIIDYVVTISEYVVIQNPLVQQTDSSARQACIHPTDGRSLHTFQVSLSFQSVFSPLISRLH